MHAKNNFEKNIIKKIIYPNAKYIDDDGEWDDDAVYSTCREENTHFV